MLELGSYRSARLDGRTLRLDSVGRDASVMSCGRDVANVEELMSRQGNEMIKSAKARDHSPLGMD